MIERGGLTILAFEDLGNVVDRDGDGVLRTLGQRFVVVAPLGRRFRVERRRRVDGPVGCLAERGHSADATGWAGDSLCSALALALDFEGPSSTLLSSDAEPVTSNW